MLVAFYLNGVLVPKFLKKGARMIRYVTTILVLAVFALGAWAQNSPLQHQHTIAATTVIDGSKNPELISDSTAYRMWLLTVSVPSNPSEQEINAQKAHLAKLHLTSDVDYLVLQPILAEFKSRYVSLVNHFNESAKAALARGTQPDQTLFLQQRDDLIQATQAAISLRLSPESTSRIDKVVQDHKKSIRIHTAKEGQ